MANKKQKNKKCLKLFLTIMFFYILSAIIILNISPASAQGIKDAFKPYDKKVEGDALDTVAKESGYDIVVGGNAITPIIANIIQTILSIIGVVFMLLMIYGGFIWMTDQGNEEKVKKAKAIIRNAAIGLVIIFASYAISYFVISAFS